MKTGKKITIILMVLFLINFNFISTVKASGFDEVTEEASGFINKGQSQAATIISSSDITEKLLPIAQALRTIGIGIILCIGVFMGIKWITAKPDEQAKLKQQSVGLLVAAVVVIGAFTIWSIALKIVSQL